MADSLSVSPSLFRRSVKHFDSSVITLIFVDVSAVRLYECPWNFGFICESGRVGSGQMRSGQVGSGPVRSTGLDWDRL